MWVWIIRHHSAIGYTTQTEGATAQGRGRAYLISYSSEDMLLLSP
jgi:hypothetical protein